MSKKNKNNTKSKLIPELRFPEFKDKPQWEVKTLGEVADIFASGDLDKESFSKEKTSEHIFPVYSNSVSDEGLYGYSKTYRYPKDSITITARGTIGIAFYRATNFVGIGRLLVVNNFRNADPLFMKYNWNFLAKFFIENSGIPQMTTNNASEVPLPLPSLAEQERIGKFFSVLDSLIQAQSKEVQLLRLRKKGLMQKMFPYEGETTPEWRFPEFKDAPQWEVKTIEEIGTIVTGNTPSKKNDNYWGGDFVWVTAEDMKSKYVSNSVNKLTELGKSKARVIPKNSVLVTCIASIGLNCINKVACATNQQINAIICNEQYCNEFVFYSISNIENLLKNYSGQTAVPIINKGDFQLLSLPLPSLAEQERIASVFSTLDALIEAKSQRLEQLKKHKKGLMQQLFP